MPLTVEELRALALQAVAHDDDKPVVDVADVLPHLDNEDRNVRVAALRVLAYSDDPAAADGILRGLDDPMKRVRAVAVKSSVRFLADERVVARLRLAVERSETGSGPDALQILGGVFHSPQGLHASEPITDALAQLAAQPVARQRVLQSLLRARALDDALTALLQEFVSSGTKEEAVLATRRMCGLRVERVELITPEQRRGAERAWGDVWFWVPE